RRAQFYAVGIGVSASWLEAMHTKVHALVRILFAQPHNLLILRDFADFRVGLNSCGMSVGRLHHRRRRRRLLRFGVCSATWFLRGRNAHSLDRRVALFTRWPRRA